MVAARGEVLALLEFLSLECDVAILLVLRHRLQQHAEPVPFGVLGTERDEDELHTHLA